MPLTAGRPLIGMSGCLSTGKSGVLRGPVKPFSEPDRLPRGLTCGIRSSNGRSPAPTPGGWLLCTALIGQRVRPLVGLSGSNISQPHGSRQIRAVLQLAVKGSGGLAVSQFRWRVRCHVPVAGASRKRINSPTVWWRCWGMAKWELVVDFVLIAASLAALRQVAGALEIVDQLSGRSFRDAYGLRDVSETRTGIGGDAYEHVRVVGDEGPTMIPITGNTFHEA